jgi:hypothetical protein
MNQNWSRTMVDDLRDKVGDQEFFEDFEDDYDYESYFSPGPKLFLGMTPIQRLVIAFMILLMACVMGLSLLLVTEKVLFPFV